MHYSDDIRLAILHHGRDDDCLLLGKVSCFLIREMDTGIAFVR